MNKNSKISLTLVLTAYLLLLTCAFTGTVAAKANGTVTRTTTSYKPASEPARLIVRRLPTLGANVIVDLYVDGAPFASVTYGRTLDATLPPGRHVLAVQATPGPIFITRTKTTVDAQGGETYTFTAEDNGSGNLVLR